MPRYDFEVTSHNCHFITKQTKQIWILFIYIDSDLKCSEIMRLFRGQFPSSKAKKLGIYLDLTHATLQDLSHNNTGNVEEFMMDVLSYWLDTDTEKSWSKLAKAVEDCGYGVLAEKIRQKSSQ